MEIAYCSFQENAADHDEVKRMALEQADIPLLVVYPNMNADAIVSAVSRTLSS